MTDEEKEIFKNLKEYMQDSIDNGYHKFIYNDLDWDFKCIDCINAIDTAINLIEKQQKEIERNKENWLLAQNEILGYAQGYEDGKKHQQTATAMVVENRQYQMIEEEIKRYKAIIEKQQKEIEELKKYEKYYEEMEEVNKKFLPVDKIKAKIEELKKYSKEHGYINMRSEINVLQSLLKDEGGIINDK